MKQKVFLNITLLLLCMVGGETALAANRALLIGIAEYKDSNLNLPGGKEDLRLMKQVSLALGYAEQDIKVLANQQASLAGIEKEIDAWLVKGAGPQDRVLLYFSGHGTQVTDRNSDESDGSDEALVPWDTAVGKDDTLLIDDRLNQLLSKITAAETFVILDSCHSGTSTKSISLSDDEYKVKYINWPGISPSFKGNFKVEPVGNSGKHVNLAAARDNESALSGAKGSLFTVGLSKAVEEKKDKKLTVLEAKEFSAKFIANALKEKPQRLFNPGIDGDQALASKNLFLVPAGSGGGGGSVVTRSALWQDMENFADKAGQKLEIRTDKPKYTIGDRMKFSVTVNKAGYLNVVSLGQDDAISTALFPNAYVQNNYVDSGKTITIPGNGGSFEFFAEGPASDVLIIVCHTEKPLNLWKEGVQNAKSIFSTMNTKDFRSFVVRATETETAATGDAAGKLITKITDK